MTTLDLSAQGLHVSEILRNAPAPVLYEHAIRFEPGTRISADGAWVAYSGAKTGRSPSDKRVVRYPESEADVWWGSINRSIDAHSFAVNPERAI